MAEYQALAETVAEESPSPVLGARPNRSLFSNSVAMGVANLLSRGLGYGYFVLMARCLDSRFIGSYALLVTTSTMVELISSLGLDKILVREMTSSPVAEGKGYFWAALPIRLTMTFVVGAAAWTLLLVFFKDSLTSPLFSALFIAAMLPVAAAKNCEAFLTAQEHLFPIAVAQLSERIVIMVAVVLLFTGRISFNGLLCSAPLATMFRLIIVALATVKIWVRSIESRRPNLPRLIRQATELFSVEILGQAYFRSDVFLLAKMDGLRQTGVYQIAYKIFDCCLSLFSGFLQAAYPRLVRDRSRRSLEVMLAGGIALLAIPVAVIIFSRHSILGMIKTDYVSGSTALVWLMLTVPLVYLTSTLANATIAAGHVKVLIFIAALLLISNVSLNLILIPKWSINGAAFSTFACELLSALVLAPFVLKKLNWSR